MKKSEMIENILKEVKSVKCSVVRIYGVCCGVGYDLTAYVSLNNTQVLKVEAHANHNGWAYPSHLRPNNPYYKYTGSNDVYQSQVIKFWEKNTGYTGFEGYLSELKKDELQVIYNQVLEA